MGIDIHEGLPDPSLVGSRPPLAMSSTLLGIAQAHSEDMYNLNYFSHNDPNGTTPFDRMINAGYDYVRAGENMAAGTDATAAELEDLMMVDAGTPGRPHRVNLLDLINPYPCSNPPCVYSEVGIGYYGGATPNGDGFTSLITEDFGAAANARPLLLGVVYDDRTHNNFYDISEGIAGVTITPSSGSYYAVSSSSGGYVFPIAASGTITVTASGPGFGPITKTVTLTGANIKLDFTASAQISTTSTAVQTTTTTSTVVGTSSSQTTTSAVSVPSIALNPNSASAESTVHVSGSGFASIDSTCTITGTSGSISLPSCTISGGTVTGSFVVANVTTTVYTITVTGTQAGDSASAVFTVNASPTQITTSSSDTTLTSTSSTTAIAQPSTVVSTSTAVTAALISTHSTTPAALTTSSSISVSTPMTLPPVPGFPWESIITGIFLGIAALVIVRRRRK